MALVLPSVAARVLEEMWRERLKSVADGRSRPHLVAGNAAAISATLAVLDQVPPQLLATCLTQRYVQLIAAAAALRAAVSAWTVQGTGYTLHDLPHIGDQLYAVYQALRESRDAAPDLTTTALAFVDDPGLREALRLDISEMEPAIRNGEWKSATVVGGSVVEALLLWALGKCDKGRLSRAITAAVAGDLKVPPPSDLNDWRLQQLISVGHAAGLIEQDTRDQCDSHETSVTSFTQGAP